MQDNTNDFNSLVQILLLKMLFANNVINYSTYEKVLKQHGRKEVA